MLISCARVKRKYVNLCVMVICYIADYFYICTGNSAKRVKFKSMENSNFGSQYNDKYLVVVDGNQVVYSNCNRKSALRSFRLRCRSSSSFRLVEFWYQFGSGRCVLLAYKGDPEGYE